MATPSHGRGGTSPDEALRRACWSRFIAGTVVIKAMREVCDNCGATLNVQPVPAVDGGFDRTCPYCGARNHEDRPAPAPAPVPPPGAPQSAPARSAAVWIVLAALGVAAAGVVVAIVARKSAPSTKSGLDAGPAAQDELSWNPNVGAPVLATIAGSEAIIGALSGKGSTLYVGAFDGATLKKRWQLGPISPAAGGYTGTHAAVGKAHVAVSDPHARLHVHDLETGTEQRSVTLTDKVDWMCPIVAPGTQDAVWIGQSDKKRPASGLYDGVLVDLATGTATETALPMPKGCDATLFQQAVQNDLPLIEGFEARREFELGSSRVLYGRKAPGTPTPMVALLDPASQPPDYARAGAPYTGPRPLATVRWRVPLPAVDLVTVRATYQDNIVGLCGKQFVGAYGVGQKAWHVAALDAQSGARLWDVTLRPIFSVDTLGGLICSDARVYVVRMDSVDVIDLASGKLTGTIGHETYASSK